MEPVEGIADLTRLQNWWDQAMPAPSQGPLTAQHIAGGRSNLTYEVRSGAAGWVLRRPPLGHVLETAHDVGREYQVITALAGTDVPVPRTYALCTDVEVIGAPFYVMEKVAGVAYRSAAQLAALGVERARTISCRLIDTLVTLHSVDPAEVGLAGFGRTEGYLSRQVRRWRRQLEASHTRALPLADALAGRLAAAVPPDSRAAIVHGDYRLDNLLVDHSDRPVALIDWEMATLGDPLMDLALLVVYDRLARMPGGAAVADATAAPGFLSADEMVHRYAVAGGGVPEHFGFYLALAAFKLAAVAEGIHFRHRPEQTVGDGLSPIGHLTEPLLKLGLSSLEGDC